MHHHTPKIFYGFPFHMQICTPANNKKQQQQEKDWMNKWMAVVVLMMHNSNLRHINVAYGFNDSMNKNEWKFSIQNLLKNECLKMNKCFA